MDTARKTQTNTSKAAARRRTQNQQCAHVLCTGVLFVGLAGSLLYTGVQWSNDRNELLNQITVLQGDLSSAETLLHEAETKLSMFVEPVPYNSAAAPIYNILLSEELQQFTYDMCVMYGIEKGYSLILGMMWRESHFDASAVSPTDDYGIMQINKINHENLQETLGVVNFLDPKDSIESGVYIIATILHKYNDENKALMAYNMGPTGASEQWARGNYSSVYSRDIISKAQAIRDGNYSAN